MFVLTVVVRVFVNTENKKPHAKNAAEKHSANTENKKRSVENAAENHSANTENLK